jgi:hypothetical protein
MTKEHGLLMRPEMIRALLANTKTETRRLITPQPPPETTALVHIGGSEWACVGNNGPNRKFPYGEVGHSIYMKERWRTRRQWDHLKPRELPINRLMPEPDIDFFATPTHQIHGRWRASIFLPKWAARIWREIAEIVPEQLLDITEAQAKAEGVGTAYSHNGKPIECDANWTYRSGYLNLWDQINPEHLSHNSPWVWRIIMKEEEAD